MELFEKYRRNNYTTPKHYLDFIKTYLTLITKKKNYTTFQYNRLLICLNKITEVSKYSIELNQKLSIKKTAVTERIEECNNLEASIKELNEIIVQMKENSLSIKDKIKENNKMIIQESAHDKEIFTDVFFELNIIKTTLNDLKYSDLVELQLLSEPPHLVQMVGECIAIIKGSKEISWESFQNLLSDPNFIESLQELDVNKITIEQQQLIDARLKNFNEFGQLKSINKIAFELYQFLQVTLRLYTFCQKSEKIKNYEIDSECIEMGFRTEENELENLEKQLTELNMKYDDATSRKRELQEETDSLQKYLIFVDEMTNELFSDSDKWEEELKYMRDDSECIIGNCLLSAGFLIYCGPFTAELRNKMLYNDWMKSIIEKNIPVSKSFRVENYLTDGIQKSGWNFQDLSHDDFSIQNGILTMFSSELVICIDPHEQALNLIKEIEKNPLKIISFYDQRYMEQFESAVKDGFSVIFQNFDYFHYILNDILAKIIQSKYLFYNHVLLINK